MDTSEVWSNLTYLTAEIPGIGGRIKERPEDFIVEELPLIEPAGSGEHLYLLIEKRNRATSDVVARLAKLFNVRKSDIGWAGLKDKRAVTRQYLSVWLPKPGSEEKGLERLAYTGLKLLRWARHTQKLRRGQLRGNRFEIRIRGVGAEALGRVREVLEILKQRGVPNFVGEQRFGYRGNNHLVGRALLLGRYQEALDLMLGRPSEQDWGDAAAARAAYEAGDYARALELLPRKLRSERHLLDLLRQGYKAEEVIQRMDPVQYQFMLNALQSAIFNRVLDRRLREGKLDQLLEGDLAWEHASGRVYRVSAAEAERYNIPGGPVERLEISPSGPMWGPGMLMPEGPAGQWEREALEEAGLREEDFNGRDSLPVEGFRRPLRCTLREPEAEAGEDAHGPYIRLRFELPAGAYATVVLREIMKPPTCRVESSLNNNDPEKSSEQAEV